MSAFRGPDQFVEFHLDCFGISVLGVLNEKDHQEGNDRSASIYDQLPRVAEVKEGTRDDPNDDETNRQHEYSGTAAEVRRFFRKLRVPSGATRSGLPGIVHGLLYVILSRAEALRPIVPFVFPVEICSRSVSNPTVRVVAHGLLR